MKQVDVAQILGAKVLRHDVSWTREVPWREMIARTADDIRKVTEYAAEKGIRTCTENHGYVLQDADRLETLILTVNHPNYGWLVDMGNFLCADEPPMHALPIAAKYAVHAHAKDFLCKKEAPSTQWFPTRGGNYLRGTAVGHGVVPIADCVAELKKAGYDGWLSVEFEGMEENIPALQAGLEYLRKIV
jgi:Sugar phosphate isomerases/epimerases